MSVKKDEVQIEVRIGTGQAAKAFKDLDGAARKVTSQMKRMNDEADKIKKAEDDLRKVTSQMKELEGAGKTQTKAYQKLVTQQEELNKTVTEGQKKLKKFNDEYPVLKKNLIGLNDQIERQGKVTGVSFNQLAKRQKFLQQQIKTATDSDLIESYQRELDELNPRLKILGARIRGTGKAMNEMRVSSSKMTGVFGKIAVGAGSLLATLGTVFAVDNIISYGKELFKTGIQSDALARKAKTVLGPELNKVTKSAKENAAAMGLTTAQYVNSATSAADLLVPMGFYREEAAAMSVETLNLAGALSESDEQGRSSIEIARILTKAYNNEREELKSLGILISDNDVKARLATQGLEKLTGKQLEQARATATLQLIIEKSADSQTLYNNNTESAIRKQAELTAKIKEIGERLATTLLPVFARLIDTAGAVADVAETIGDGFAKLLNPAKELSEEFDEQTERVAGLEKELVPLLSRYDELTSKGELSKIEQEELGTLIARVGDLAPTAITQIDEYGKALGISADKAREFIKAEQARLEFINEDAIVAVKKQIDAFAFEQKRLSDEILTGKLTFNPRGTETRRVALSAEEINEAREKLAATTRKLQGAEAELNRLRGVAPEPSTEKTKEGLDEIIDLTKLTIAELKKLATAEAFAEIERRKGLAKAAEDRAKERKKEFELALKALQIAHEREQLILEAKFIKKEITEKEFNNLIHEENKRFYQEELDLLEQFGKSATNEALKIQNQLLEAQSFERAPVAVPQLLAAPELEEIDRSKDNVNRIENETERELILLENKFAKLLIAEQDFELQKLELQESAIERRLTLLREAGLTETNEFIALETEKLNVQKEMDEQRTENKKRTAELEATIEQQKIGIARGAFDIGIELLSADEKSRKKHAAALQAFETGKILVNLYSELSNIFKNFSTIPFVGQALAAVQAAFSTARAFGAIRKIKSQKFFAGGIVKGVISAFTGQKVKTSPNVPTQEGGDNVLAFLKPNEVVLNEQQQRALGGDATFAKIGVPGFAGGGIVESRLTTVNTTPNVNFVSDRTPPPSQSGDTRKMEAMFEQMMTAFERFPTTLTAEVVYEDLKTTETEVAYSETNANI